MFQRFVDFYTNTTQRMRKDTGTRLPSECVPPSKMGSLHFDFPFCLWLDGGH
jgi:hypothetical protein